jgi:hypothetical protein|tara:strand:+ start:191 stop:559 length:369 start_codon:yes stop_codon:yes gene_type:complete
LQHPILFNIQSKALAVIALSIVMLISSCSTAQMQSKISDKSDPSLCYSMIFEQDSMSTDFFALMLSEALSRNLNCKDIAQEIIDFRKKTTGNDSGEGPNSSGEASSSDYSNEGINWVTGQST